MELIPILSAIILIATISTFILAVGAYIMYKVRERRGQTEKQQGYKQVEAELISPRVKYAGTEDEAAKKEYVYAPLAKESAGGISERASGKNAFETSMRFNAVKESADKKENSKFFKYTPEGYVPLNKSSETEKPEESLKWR